MPRFRAEWKVVESDGISIKCRLLGEGMEIREADSSLELKQKLETSLRKFWAEQRDELIREYQVKIMPIS